MAATDITVLKPHPLADLFPLMEGEDFDALVADIKKNTLRYKITLYEGKILDGRNRYRAMLAAGHTPTKGHFHEYKPAVPGDTPLSYVITANLHRRHLTVDQKRNLIAELLKADPTKSDRQIAKTVKASPTYVGKVRAQKEATGDVSTVDTRTDTQGRKQPAKRKKPRPTATEADEVATGAKVAAKDGASANDFISKLDRFTALFFRDMDRWVRQAPSRKEVLDLAEFIRHSAEMMKHHAGYLDARAEEVTQRSRGAP